MESLQIAQLGYERYGFAFYLFLARFIYLRITRTSQLPKAPFTSWQTFTPLC